MSLKKERSVCLEFKAVGNLIRREAGNYANKTYIDSATGANGWVIGFIGDNEGKDVFQRDLEEKFSIRRSTASSILKLMEKKGLISREPVEYDARLKRLKLTAKANEIHSMILDNIAAIEKKITCGLTEEELNSFFETVDKIKSNMEYKSDT